MAKAQKIQYKEPSISQKDLKIIFQQFAKNIYICGTVHVMTKNEGGRVTIKDIMWKLKENAGRMKSLG